MKDIIEELNILEGGYARMARMLHGIVPSVRTLAFITAENPLGKILPPEENNKLNAELATTLKNQGFGFYKVKGKYRNEENSFMVMNIPKGNLEDYAIEFNQESYIFGYKEQTADGELGMVFEYHETKGQKKNGKLIYRTTGERRIYVKRNDTKKPPIQGTREDDPWTEYKGIRFQIPFFDFDDETEINPTINKRFSNGKVVDRGDVPHHAEVVEAVYDIETSLDFDLGKTTEEWKQHNHRVGSGAYGARQNLRSQVRELIKYIGS